MVEIDRVIAAWPDLCGDCRLKHYSLADLRVRRGFASVRKERFAKRAGCLRRLASLDPDDPRMQEAYAVLRREFTRDGQWHRFFHAAYHAMQDYEECRGRLRDANALRQHVVETATVLVRAICQLRETGVRLPIELMNHAKEKTWSPYYMSDLDVAVMVRELLNKRSSPKRDDLVQLLCEATKAAKKASLSFDTWDGAVDVAISKRKRNIKTEYLRAFGHLLLHCGAGEEVRLTPGVRRAMSVTSTVAINSDVIVTEDDVRKALPKEPLPLPSY